MDGGKDLVALQLAGTLQIKTIPFPFIHDSARSLVITLREKGRKKLHLAFVLALLWVIMKQQKS